MSDQLDLFDEEEIEEDTSAAEDELTYGEIYSSALLNGEVIITIAVEDEDKAKIGIKNYKNKQNQKLRENGLALDNSTITFLSAPSQEFPGCTDLSVSVTKKGVVKIKGMRIPENNLPD